MEHAPGYECDEVIRLRKLVIELRELLVETTKW